MNLFLFCEEWIKLQRNFKKAVETKIISNVSLMQSFIILLWMLFRMLFLDAFMILLWMPFRMLSLDTFIILLWNCWIGRWKDLVNSLSVNPTKWPNTLKPFVGKIWQTYWVCLTILWSLHLKGQRSYSRRWMVENGEVLNN